VDGVRQDWERTLAEHWIRLDDVSEDEFLATIGLLVGQIPSGSGIASFEMACAYDSTGHSDLAVPLYRIALGEGLTGIRRRRAVIQLASSLRNLGQFSESYELLAAEKALESNELDDAVSGFLALTLIDLGREREATSLALQALARHLPRYQRSLGNYAKAIVEDPNQAQ
jgi:tetratricopeptide (TPR) repeat protein